MESEVPEMTMREFIRENRTELDKIIRKQVPNLTIDDAERRMWIENDQSLYEWAREEGVDLS